MTITPRMTTPKPAYPGQCNAIGPACREDGIARVVTALDNRRFADDVCADHLERFVSELMSGRSNIVAIVAIDFESEA